MEKNNDPKRLSRPLSFVKSVKDKIMGTVFRESPVEDAVKLLESAQEEIDDLKTSKANLQSKWLLLTKKAGEKSSIEAELAGMENEKKHLTGEIAGAEEKIRALYASKDNLFEEQEKAKADLKRILEEKRPIQDDCNALRKKEREKDGLKKELADARSRQEAAARDLEEIGLKLKFANANMDTLVLDLTVAKKALDESERGISAKEESISSSEKARSTVNEALAKLDEFINVKAGIGDALQAFRDGVNELKNVRETIKDVGDKYSAIPKRIAELSAANGKDKERTELLKEEKSLSEEIERLRAKEKKTAMEAEKNKSALETVEKASLELKRVMIAAGLKDLVPKVDSSSTDTLRMSIEKRSSEIAGSINAQKKGLIQAQSAQSQKRSAITRMTEELNKLVKNASSDKRETELQKEKSKETKNQAAILCGDLEARLKEKGAALSEDAAVNIEMKRVEALETDAVGTINRINSQIESVDRAAQETLKLIHKQKERIRDMEELERFLRDRLDWIKKIERLEATEKELSLSQQVAAKYEADLRGLKKVIKKNGLLKNKLALLEEAELPPAVMEARLSEMSAEKSRLEEALAPLRTELDFTVEKRDNCEMDISFAKEALKKVHERRMSLERKLAFITKESGSVKNLQGKLADCEGRLAAARKNITEIQTRLDFTIATEDLVKEKLEESQGALKKVDAGINTLKGQIENEESALSESRSKLADYERGLESEKAARLETETKQATLETELKKVAIECGALAERKENLEAFLSERRQKVSAIEDTIPSYNTNLEKQEKLEKKIQGLNEKIDGIQSRIDDAAGQVSELQAKKRELMEETLKPLGKAEEKPDKDLEKINALKKERKNTREKIKETEEKIKGLKEKATDKPGADKEKQRQALVFLRSEREALHKKIDQINEQLDDLKEEGHNPDKGDTGSRDEAKKLAQAIGEMDIKVLTITKNIGKLNSEAEENRQRLDELSKSKNELGLEIESQKSLISPLDEIKKKIKSLEKEEGSTKASLEDKEDQRDALARKKQEIDKGIKGRLERIGDAEKGLSQITDELESAENKTTGLKRKLEALNKNRAQIYAEFKSFKDEMDTIMRNTSQDRELVSEEKAVAENAHSEVEETKKQLAEAMSILTGKAGSVDDLKLEAASSAEEEKDVSDRINGLEMEFKSVTAAIEGIESNAEPKTARLEHIAWAEGVIGRNLRNQRLAARLKETETRLKELEGAKGLLDEYKDLSAAKVELKGRVGELKGYLDLETRLMAAEQARHEIMAQASENAERLESQEALAKSIEEKYKAAQEDKVRIKGMLDEVSHQFESAKAMWGRVEDLSRIKDSLELKINQLKDKFGAVDNIGEKFSRLDNEKAALSRRVKELEETCRALQEEKGSLERSLARSKADFENVLKMIKKSKDEAKEFLSSKA